MWGYLFPYPFCIHQTLASAKSFFSTKCNCRCEGIICTLTLSFQSLFLQIQLVTLIIPSCSFFFLLNHEEVGSCYPLSFSPFCSIHSHKPSLCLFPSLSMLCVLKKTIRYYREEQWSWKITSTLD